MSRRRPRRGGEGPEQLILPPVPAAPKTRTRTISAPEQAARAYIAKRAKPSVVPGRVKLTITLELPRELAVRLSERAIRESVSLEAVILEALGRADLTGS